MPYANPEDERARTKRYREQNREKLRQVSLSYYHNNKTTLSEKRRQRRKENSEYICARDRRSYQRKRERVLKRKAEYYRENRDKLLAYAATWRKINSKKRVSAELYRIKTDPQYRLRNHLRSRIRGALMRNKKTGRTLELVGCSIDQLSGWLEIQFRPGMTWENYGPVWHIDHKRPCSSFDLSDPSQQRECFNYKNLQPLFASENLSKSDRLDFQLN
jgi:hypothetical protein